MKHTFTLLLFALAAIMGGGIYAQDVTFTLGDLPTTTQNKVDATYGGINFCYIKNSKILGAYIYRNDVRYGDHSLTITSEKNITKIEFEGELSQSDGKRTADVTETTGSGTFTFSTNGTSVWTGSSKQVRFAGMSETTSYSITTIRLWIEGGGEGGTIDILQRPGKDVHYYAQGHTLPYDGRPSTLAVVAHSQFRNVLQDYLVWKTQQGYHVEEFYADEISEATGKTLDKLALEIRSRLMALDPQPSYVLLAGDCEEVPYFEPRTTMAGGHDAVTDFFYGEYTGDHFPEAAVGRLSASNADDLKVQLDKTKHMAFIKPADADWMHKSLIIHGPASDISTQKGADFGMNFGKKWENNDTKMVYYASSAINAINEGCSYVAYLGHGWMDYWDGPKFYRSHAKNLVNKDMYPVVLGLTCLSGSFQVGECLGEAFMRNPNGGAVAYIGATRESWDGSDNLFFMGGNSSYNSFEHIGFMRSLFHPDAEDESQVTRTIGDAFNIGKFADRFLGEHQPFRQFMEFFTLLGDPTYQPYITVPKQMTISAAASVAAGRCVEVLTAPDAVVCISQGRKVVAVGVADHDGKLSLKVPADAPTGACIIYSSAPFYNDYYTDINVTAYSGGEDVTEGTKKLPKVEYTDVINVTTAASALPINSSTYLGYQPEPFGVESLARYTMWAATNTIAGSTPEQYCNWETYPNDESCAIYLRNRYEQNSFITTQSAGNVAYVSVDWLHSCGQAEILGVYGSKTPYTSTLQAWNGNAGTKLGELRKGTNDYIEIEDEWPFILVRAEDYEGYFGRSSVDQNDVFFKSLTIGWNKHEESEDKNFVSANKFYKIKSKVHGQSKSGLTGSKVCGYMEAATVSANNRTYAFNGAGFDGDDFSRVFQFVDTDGDGNYNLYAQGGYMAKLADGSVGAVESADDSKAADFSIEKSNNEGYFYLIDKNAPATANYRYAQLSDWWGFGITGWNTGAAGSDDDLRCQWAIEEVTSVSVPLTKIGNYSYATLYAPYAVSLGGDVVAYTATLVGDYLIPAEVEGTIPAGTAVILYSASGAENAELTLEAATHTYEGDNDLVGTYRSAAAGNDKYVFSAVNGKVGFYKFADATLAANKAYYTNSANVRGFVLDFGGEQTTDIINVDNNNNSANLYFDLQGRRVNNATRGILLQGGKKVVK